MNLKDGIFNRWRPKCKCNRKSIRQDIHFFQIDIIRLSNVFVLLTGFLAAGYPVHPSVPGENQERSGIVGGIDDDNAVPIGHQKSFIFSATRNDYINIFPL